MPGAPRLRIALLPLLGAITLAGAPSPAVETEPTTFGASVEVEVVEVQVFVSDGKGTPVRGLTAADFRIEVDGHPRPVVNFYEARGTTDVSLVEGATAAGADVPSPAPAAATPPPPPSQQLSLVVLVDDAHLQPNERKRTLERLRPMLAERIAAGDQVMLTSLDHSLQVHRRFDETGSAEAALQAIERRAPGGVHAELEHRQTIDQIRSLYVMSGCQALTEMQQVANFWRGSVEHESRTSLDALEDLLRRLAGRSGRKALLYVSSGLPLNPGLEAELLINELCGGTQKPAVGLATEVQEVARVANGAQVTLYSLDAGGQRVLGSAADAGPGLSLADVAMVRGDNQDTQFALAHETGGTALLESNKPELLLADLARDLTTYYSLGFAPTAADAGRPHTIAITTTRPGLHVRHRSAWEPLGPEQRLTARVLAALALGGEETNPLRARLTTGTPRRTDDGSFELPLALEVPASALALVPEGERRHGSVRVLLAVADASGGTTPVRALPLPVDLPAQPADAAVPLNVRLRVRPGLTTIVVAVHDEVGQETSVLRRQVTAGSGAR